VNVLSPGHIDTPILESLQQCEAFVQMKKQMENNVPLRRLGDPDEIAKAVSFLASDQASYVSVPSSTSTAASPKFELRLLPESVLVATCRTTFPSHEKEAFYRPSPK